MTDTVISIENLSKCYRLGTISTSTFRGDVNRWWAMKRGKPDPYLKIGEADHGNREGEILWALKDINITVKQGEALGIIGRNGAGKSTLLKILSRVTAPTSGVVHVKGRISSLLEVGTGFHPDLTGRENILLNGVIMGMSRAEITSKFDEIVDFSGIEKFIDTPVKRYSSGMYVRLAFAVAAHLDPDILVVDEVLAVGDAAFQRKAISKMQDVSRGEGRTVLFVSHSMASIENLCQEAILLENGKISHNGPVQETIDIYLNQGENHELISFAKIAESDANHKTLKSICLRDEQGNQTGSFKVGEKIVFEINLDSIDVTLNSPRILIGVSSRKHGPICYFSSDQMVSQPFKVGRKTVIKCIWDGCYLIPGLYYVSVKINAISPESANFILRFEILEKDLYRTGKEVAGNPETVILPQGHWSFDA